MIVAYGYGLGPGGGAIVAYGYGRGVGSVVPPPVTPEELPLPSTGARRRVAQGLRRWQIEEQNELIIAVAVAAITRGMLQ